MNLPNSLSLAEGISLHRNAVALSSWSSYQIGLTSLDHSEAAE